MKASVVILLLLLLSTCHGEEQDGSSPLGIVPTTKCQKNAETPQRVSCPDPTDIEPCECSNLGMDCSNVQNEEQLRKAFSAFFPTTEIYQFTMKENHGVKVFEDGVFGNVSFQKLDIYNCVLETVETDALTLSLSRLTRIWINYCMLEVFPLERLEEFTSLKELGLPANNIHTLPPLSSSSLQVVTLGFNVITHLTPDVFTLLSEVEEIDLNGNHLTEIPTGTFTGIPNLEYLDLSKNNISSLQTLTFDLASSSIYHSAYLYLYNNSIESVEVDAFKGVAAPAQISMLNNALTRFPEEVWRPVLEKGIYVDLKGNDLACDCDVAWLVRDPELLKKVWYARCADGTWLDDLNPADFDICD